MTSKEKNINGGSGVAYVAIPMEDLEAAVPSTTATAEAVILPTKANRKTTLDEEDRPCRGKKASAIALALAGVVFCTIGIVLLSGPCDRHQNRNHYPHHPTMVMEPTTVAGQQQQQQLPYPTEEFARDMPLNKKTKLDDYNDGPDDHSFDDEDHEDSHDGPFHPHHDHHHHPHDGPHGHHSHGHDGPWPGPHHHDHDGPHGHHHHDHHHGPWHHHHDHHHGPWHHHHHHRHDGPPSGDEPPPPPQEGKKSFWSHLLPRGGSHSHSGSKSASASADSGDRSSSSEDKDIEKMDHNMLEPMTGGGTPTQQKQQPQDDEEDEAMETAPENELNLPLAEERVKSP